MFAFRSRGLLTACLPTCLASLQTAAENTRSMYSFRHLVIDVVVSDRELGFPPSVGDPPAFGGLFLCVFLVL